MARSALRSAVACACAVSALGLAAPDAPAQVTREEIRSGVDRIRDDARAHEPVPGDKRLETYAEKASRLPALSGPLAGGAIIAGLLLLFAGRRLFRIAIVVYFAVLLGMGGHSVGASLETPRPLLGAALGVVVGAALSFPFRVLLRSAIGAATAGIVAFLIVQAYTSSVLATAACVLGALIAGGIVTFFFPAPLLVVGFSIAGSVAISVGVLSLFGEQADGRLIYQPWHLLCVAGGAGIGTVVQAIIGIGEELDEDEDDDD
jgi:hypothetical protein